MKFKITGMDDPKCAELAEKVLNHEWPKVEKHFIEVFKDVFLREVMTGIKATRDELEKSSLEVLERAGYPVGKNNP